MVLYLPVDSGVFGSSGSFLFCILSSGSLYVPNFGIQLTLFKSVSASVFATYLYILPFDSLPLEIAVFKSLACSHSSFRFNVPLL